MQITEDDWINYKNKMAALSDKAAENLEMWLQVKGGYQNVSRDQLIKYMYGLATYYGEATASLAAEMYDEVAALSGVTVPSAEVAETASYGEIASAVKAVTRNTTTDSNLGNVVVRYVKRAAEDTTLKNVKRDEKKGAQFAWVPAGDTCAFCMMLASNGWQNQSKKAMKNGHASHIHPNCDCTYAVRFDGKSNVKGYNPDKYKAMYENAEGRTWNDKLNSMRRIQYQENKDRINVQKRANYKEKQQNDPRYRNKNAEQNRPIALSKNTINEVTKKRNFVLRKDENRNEVYISENAKIKPKELSNIISDLRESITKFNGNMDHFPRIVIVSNAENKGALAAYNCINNTMYIIPEAGNRTKIITLQENLAKADDPKSTAYHETWHWIQAERYKEAHGNITEANLKDYKKWLREKSKNHLDKRGITSENVINISQSAEFDYMMNRFDEVEAELQVILGLKGK